MLPFIGVKLVPDELIRRLAKCVQSASRLYRLDLPNSEASTPSEQDDSTFTIKETRFDSDFDRQATGVDMHGTTAEIVGVGRERFGYWCFDLLFLMGSDVVEGESRLFRFQRSSTNRPWRRSP